jgi:peptide/nickel transport system permease protein
MRTYILKRLLLMIPTLFGITLIVWIVVTSAPGDPGQSQVAEARGQKTGMTSESRRIFRAQFNLDKPLFWNDYVDLGPEEILDTLRTANDPDLTPKERRKARETLDDWGNFAVPGLVAALDLVKTPWEEAIVLERLPVNAKRVATPSVGQKLTEADKQLNRDILTETREIEDHLTLSINPLTLDAWKRAGGAPAGGVPPDVHAEMDRVAAGWKAWLQAHKSRWEWSASEKLKIRLFDTKFAKYWANLAKGDLGISNVHREPVLDLIISRLPISITLSVTSLLLAYLISIPLGVWSAVRHGTHLERGSSTALFMLYSLPSFFVASLLLRYLGIGRPFRWIPVQGFESPDTFHMTTTQHVLDVLHHVLAPIFCLTYASFAALSRYAKSGLLNVIRSDYVRTARAKGVAESKVILKHALRNGIIPIVTLLGSTLPVIVGGSIVIESVFSIPGIGYLLWDSILQRDYNVVIGESVIVAVLTMVGILISDLTYAVVDPRIRYQ